MSHTLSASDLSSYPSEARKFASDHLAILQQLPPVLCALLLKEIAQYDWQFPAERADMGAQLRWLQHAEPAEFQSIVAPFASLTVSKDVMELPWAAQPGPFIEKLTSDLWSTHSIDAFHAAGKQYGTLLDKVRTDDGSGKSRLCIVFVGYGADRGQKALFEKLRPYGTYFSKVDLSNAVSHIGTVMQSEAAANPAPYGHWYVDGDRAEGFAPSANSDRANVATLSYAALEPLRRTIVQTMNATRTSGGGGPEQLRSNLAQMHSQGLDGTSGMDPIMREFVLRLFTEGSGTQVFSTTFVQWAAREILRRARPQSMFLRYRPRQIEQPMDELLRADRSAVVLDPRGSLVDAEMGAFYTWINLQRLSGAEKSRFLVCNENGQEALVIAPGLPRGTVSNSSATLKDVLNLIS